jgi:hypothetical protein
MRGWCLGSEAFRKELLAQMSERRGAEHYGAEFRQSAENKAQRIVQEELDRLDWPEAELTVRQKGDPKKLRIALRLRRETTMTLSRIAQRLKMGTKRICRICATGTVGRTRTESAKRVNGNNN